MGRTTYGNNKWVSKKGDDDRNAQESKQNTATAS